MKKVLLFATACLFVAGAAFAHTGDKGKKKKKCAKGKTCCTKTAGKEGCAKTDKDASATKACCKDKAKTVSM